MEPVFGQVCELHVATHLNRVFAVRSSVWRAPRRPPRVMLGGAISGILPESSRDVKINHVTDS